jgi:hypothetical protein
LRVADADGHEEGREHEAGHEVVAEIPNIVAS